MARKRIFVATLLLSFFLVVVLLASTVATVTVPISPQRVSQALAKHNLNYEIDFDDVRLSWSVRQNQLEFQFNSVDVRGSSGDIEARFPQIILHTAPSFLITRELQSPSFTIVEPNLRLERTAGGALKIDIGQTKEGFAGTFVLNILTDMASYSGRPWAESVSPELNLRQAQLTLVDEASGSQFKFDPADVSLWSDADGVYGNLEVETVTFGERVKIELLTDFDTSDQSYAVDAELHNLNPAILARLLPNISLLSPMEIALDVKLEAKLDSHFSIQQAKLFASGSDGSLEVSSLIGRNVELKDFSTTLTLFRSGAETILDIVSLEWSGHKVLGQIVHFAPGSFPSTLHLDLITLNRSWSEIAPKWFSHLNLLKLPDLGKQVIDVLPQRLALTVEQDETDMLRGAGSIYVPNLPDHAPNEKSNVYEEIFQIGLELGGSRQSPVFKFDPALETLHRDIDAARDCKMFGLNEVITDLQTCLMQYRPRP